MPNLIVAAAQALDRRKPLHPDRIQARAPVAVGPKHQVPTTATNLFAGGDAIRNIQAFHHSSSVYSITLRRASDAARIPWALYRNTTSSDVGDEREEVADHAFLRVWRRPNPTMTKTGRAFRQLMLMYLDVVGEATAVVTTWGKGPNATPAELWVVRPDRLVPVPDPHEGLAGWIHTSVDGEQTPLRVDQVLQIKYPSLLDPLRGFGPVQAAMLEIDASILSTEWFRNFYLNSAQPGGIVATDEFLSQPQFDEWVIRWNEQHAGPGNAHRVALMDAGAKWLGAQMSMLDMQFADMVTANRDAVRETFGISKVILGQTGDVNRAASLAQQEIYARYSLQDRIDLLSEMANGELLPRFGSARVAPGARPVLVVEPSEDIVPNDIELENDERDSRVGAAVALITAGGDPVSTLEAFGLPPVDFTPTAEAEPVDVDTGESEQSRARELAEIVQKLYLGVGTILTWAEARQVLIDEGMDLDPNEPPPVFSLEPPDAPEGAEPAKLKPPEPAAALVSRTAPPMPPDSELTVVPVAITDDPDDPVDLSHLQESWERHLADLADDWARAETDQKAEIVAAVAALLAARGIEGLVDLEVDTGATSLLLAEAMVAIAAEAAGQIADEAEEQDVDLDPGEPDDDELTAVAVVIAATVGSRLVSSARNTATRAWSGGGSRDRDVVVDAAVNAVRAGLAELSEDGPRVALGAALTGAQNEGRAATIEQTELLGVVTASEVLDNATCGPCEDIDGTIIGTTADMAQIRRVYGGAYGGYVRCEGRERCRGTWVVQWTQEG
jgi:HK97 family phage portal protein